ncbi:hypothetical protein [Meiothermus sp.]|uniref:hypothetical protein n=1 Tax=Meiothermus sp. TaxID=1955249 RepID=UPI00307DD938
MSYLLEWYNFIFALPLAVGLLLSVGIVFSGLGASGEADQSAEAGQETPDPAHQGDGHTHPSSLLGTLGGWFGFGKGASLTLLLPILLATWGLVGLLVNTALGPWLPPAVFFPIAAVLGLLGAGLVGNGVASVVQSLVRSRGRNVRQQDLVGCGGRAAFRIDAHGGAANVRDKTGNIHRVVCKTLPGEAPIETGREILVVDFDPKQGTYYVQAHPFPEEIPARS